MPSTLRRKIALAFVLALVAFAAIGWISYRETQTLIAAESWVARSNHILAVLHNASSAIGETQVAESSWIVTHDHRLLDTCSLTLFDALHHVQQLKELTAGNRDQQARLNRLQATVERNRTLLEKLRRIDNPALAPQLALEMSEEWQKESTHGSLDAIESQENALLQSNSGELEITARRTVRIVLLLAILAFVLLAAAFRTILSDLEKREQDSLALQDAKQQLRCALEKEQELARVDVLTGVANRRAFYEILDLEKARAIRYHRPMTLVYVDVDNFKLLNDSLGHSTGDEVLVTAARSLRDNLRLSDKVARIGGDEFAILLPETAPDVATTVLLRLQQSLRTKMSFCGWNISFSMGAASFLHPDRPLDNLLHIADEVMYGIKHHGKDNLSVVVFG